LSLSSREVAFKKERFERVDGHARQLSDIFALNKNRQAFLSKSGAFT